MAIRPASRRSRALATCLAAIVSLTGAACTGDSRADEGGGTVLISASAEPASVFPPTVQDETGRIVTDLVFDRLADIGDGLNTVGDEGFTPRIAKSWEWGRDSLSITFRIDPAARFHDGAPVRASDLRYSLSLIKEPAVNASAAPLVTNIDSVHVADSATAVVYFQRRLPEQFYDIAYQVAILPEHVYGKVKPSDMATSDALRAPVGSGRFRFSRWQAGSHIELVSDTNNYKGRAKLDRVVFMLGQAPPAAAAAVLAGETDFYASFPVDQVSRLDSGSAARAIPNPQLAYGFFGMRQYDRKSRTAPHPVLSDLAVRRAISMAIDRQGMLTNVYYGAGTLANGPFPGGTGTADTTIRLPSYDTTAAKALLDSAGWLAGTTGLRARNGRPLKFEIMIPATSTIRGRYAELIQESLRRVGIQAELVKVPFPLFLQHQGQGNFDTGLFVVGVDPSLGGTKQSWGSAGVITGTNWLSYANPRVDALLDSVDRSSDPRAVRMYATRAYQAIVDDAPAVWLFNGFTQTAVNRRIHTAPYRADGWWNHLADWAIPSDRFIDRDRVGLVPSQKD